MLNAQTLRDRHAGERCNVWASGVSLENDAPEDMVGINIPVNHSIWAPARLGFPPANYWLFSDRAAAIDLCATDYEGVHKLVYNQAARVLAQRGYTESADGLGKTYMEFSGGNQLPSKNDERILLGNTTTHAAIHLAWILGCSDVRVYGLDLGPGPDGRWHWWEKAPTGRNRRAVYDGMRKPLSELIAAMRSDGVTITTSAARL